MYAYALAEGAHTRPISHDHVVVGPVSRLNDLSDPCDYAETRQQHRDAVGKVAAGRRVVQLRRTFISRYPHASVGSPQVPQEDADLHITCRVQDSGNLLLIRVQVLDSQLAEPVVHRVTPAVRAMDWGR